MVAVLFGKWGSLAFVILGSITVAIWAVCITLEYIKAIKYKISEFRNGYKERLKDGFSNKANPYILVSLFLMFVLPLECRLIEVTLPENVALCVFCGIMAGMVIFALSGLVWDLAQEHLIIMKILNVLPPFCFIELIINKINKKYGSADFEQAKKKREREMERSKVQKEERERAEAERKKKLKEEQKLKEYIEECILRTKFLTRKDIEELPVYRMWELTREQWDNMPPEVFDYASNKLISHIRGGGGVPNDTRNVPDNVFAAAYDKAMNDVIRSTERIADAARELAKSFENQPRGLPSYGIGSQKFGLDIELDHMGRATYHQTFDGRRTGESFKD